MSLSGDDLGRVVRIIWSTQLGLELEDADPGVLEQKLSNQEAITVGVRFSGGFTGVLVQRCSEQASVMAAHAAFATTEDDLASTDVRDVLAELANVTAGNLKTILPAQSEFSFPAAMASDEVTGSLVAEAAFELDGEPLIVRLTSQEA